MNLWSCNCQFAWWRACCHPQEETVLPAGFLKEAFCQNVLGHDIAPAFLSHVTSPAFLSHVISPAFLSHVTSPAFFSHVAPPAFFTLSVMIVTSPASFSPVNFACFLQSCYFICFQCLFSSVMLLHYTVYHCLFSLISVALLTNCSDKEVQLRCCRSLGNLAMESSSHLAIAQAQALPALVKVLEIQYVEVEKQNSVEASTTESGRKTVDDSSENEIHVEANFPSVSMVKAACRILRQVFVQSSPST